MIRSAGVYEFSERITHEHDFHQMVVGIGGLSKMGLSGQEGVIDRSQGCLIPSDCPHYYFGNEENTSLTINFYTHQHSDSLKRLFRDARFFSIDKSLQMFLRFASMELSHCNPESSLSQQVADTFVRLITTRLLEEHEDEKQINLEVLDRYLENRLDQKINVQDLAGCVHLSPSHFHAVFRKETGSTPHRYVMEKRLKRALMLLRTSNTLSIADVAHDTGFSSQSALNNALKQYHGITPRQYQQRYYQKRQFVQLQEAV